MMSLTVCIVFFLLIYVSIFYFSLFPVRAFLKYLMIHSCSLICECITERPSRLSMDTGEPC